MLDQNHFQNDTDTDVEVDAMELLEWHIGYKLDKSDLESLKYTPCEKESAMDIVKRTALRPGKEDNAPAPHHLTLLADEVLSPTPSPVAKTHALPATSSARYYAPTLSVAYPPVTQTIRKTNLEDKQKTGKGANMSYRKIYRDEIKKLNTKYLYLLRECESKGCSLPKNLEYEQSPLPFSESKLSENEHQRTKYKQLKLNLERLRYCVKEIEQYLDMGKHDIKIIQPRYR